MKDKHLTFDPNIIQQHPLFNSLTDVEISELISAAELRILSKDTLITKQGDLVNSIFFIGKGLAEVSYVNENLEKNVIASLHTGEAIGLSETGFYSTTGKRTATVRSITEMTVLEIPLFALEKFFQQHPKLNKEMQHQAEFMLRLHLIKKAAPFAKISFESMRWLAEQMQKKKLSTGQMIFNKDEMGQEAYLIESGSVEIFLPDETNAQIAKLTSPMVFGEASLLLNLPRSASAKALENTTLLVLNKEALRHITETEAQAAKSLESLIKLRSRPSRLPSMEIYPQKDNEGETIYTLKNPILNKYYRLQEEGYFLWKLMDGRHTLRDLVLAFKREYDIFDSAMITDFIMELNQEGFIEDLSNKEKEHVDKSTFFKFLDSIKKIMEASISFGNVDGWLAKTYNSFFFIFFKKPVVIFNSLLIIIGFSIFVWNFNYYLDLLRHTENAGWLLLAAILATNFTTPLHELAHAYTTKSFGKKVLNFGVGWFWITPIAFCDTSDMWIAKRSHRVAVDFAGIFCDTLTGAILSILLLFLHTPSLIVFVWLFAFFKFMMAYPNLNPLLEFDGYYAMMDITGKDNLRNAAFFWLINFFKTKKLQFKKYKVEILYWTLCCIYLFGTIAVNYYIINTLLAGILTKRNPLLLYSLTFFAVSVTFLIVWGNAKDKIYLEKK